MRLAYNVREVAKMTGQSKVYIYQLIHSGFFEKNEFVELKVGVTKSKSHYLINAKGIERLTGIRPDLEYGKD